MTRDNECQWIRMNRKLINMNKATKQLETTHSKNMNISIMQIKVADFVPYRLYLLFARA